jgi:hypothetical protein
MVACREEIGDDVAVGTTVGNNVGTTDVGRSSAVEVEVVVAVLRPHPASKTTNITKVNIIT